jgi:hypothetical protein
VIEKETISTEKEKNIVIGCITSDKFVKDISQLIDDFSVLESRALRTIGNWCLAYFKEYKEAPKRTIKDIFQAKKDELDKERIEYIDKVLSHLNTVYDQDDYNVDYHLALAKKYIDYRHLNLLSERIKGFSLQGDIERAYSEVANFKKIENPMGMGIDVTNDKEFISDIFAEPDEDVFHIPGDLGKAIQNKYRGEVMGVAGRQKLGKSWTLMELAKYAALDGKNVCYYTLEMKASIMGKRIFQSLSGRLKPDKADIETVIPYFVKENEKSKKVKITFDYMRPKSLSISDCEKAQRLMKMKGGGGLRVFDRTTGGATMEQIEYSLENLEHYDNFVCDVCVIDYDDIIEVKGAKGNDDRSRLNHVWLYAKKIASERNILVIMASQNGRQTFKRDADVDDVAGDIRKFSHVSHWITLNQTPQEKKAHILRLKVDGRHDEFNPLDEVVCLQNLSIGKAVLDSKFKRDIENYEEWVESMNSEGFDL